MSSSQRVQVVATVVLASCALILTSLVAWRELRPTPPTEGREKALVPISNWEEVIGEGHFDGPADARITLVVFEDFECPACKYFATVTLPKVLKEFPNKVKVVRRHSPLAYHRFAYPAARAAECAAGQGRFAEMHEVLFEKSDSFGLKSFDAFAKEAGVPDSNAFRMCNEIQDSLPKVNRDRDLVVQIGGTGTPTVALNGMRFSGVPSAEQLQGEIQRLLESARTP
jgi:protein-disulfide isomerase